MQMHSETWGHIALNGAPTEHMTVSEEQHEMSMLRCRYGKKSTLHPFALLCGLLPVTDEIIHNPATLQGIADLFQIKIDKAFAY